MTELVALNTLLRGSCCSATFCLLVARAPGVPIEKT
jgi:hypothetical protein